METYLDGLLASLSPAALDYLRVRLSIKTEATYAERDLYFRDRIGGLKAVRTRTGCTLAEARAMLERPV